MWRRIVSSLFFLVFTPILHAQTITTFAGMGVGSGGFSGDGGPATAAHIGGPVGSAFDSSGNFYFAIRGSNRVRMVSNTGIINTSVGTGVAGFSGDGYPATMAQINQPADVAFDVYGNLYIDDYYNNRIRKVDRSSGIITTVVGNGTAAFSGDGGPATAASLNYPVFICFDPSNNMYISDWGNNRVRMVNSLGIISTIAGNGSHGYTSDGGLADTTTLNLVWSMAIDSSGNLILADNGNFRIRKINFSTGIITTIVGNGVGVYSGEGLPATVTQLVPYGISFDKNWNLFISDLANQRVYKVDSAGIVNTIAGNGVGGFIGDGGPATAAELYNPEYNSNDACGNLYISDVANQRIRKVTFPGTIIPPTITISVSPIDTVCEGTSVTFTSSVSMGGTVPTYQWFVNGVAVSAGNSYTYIPANGDNVYCVLTSNSPCASIPTATSNTMVMVVDTFITPSISLSGLTSAAIGSTVTVNATIAGAGGSYIIHWLRNGTALSTTTVPTVTYTKGAGADTITARIVSTATGCYDSTAATGFIIATANTGISILPTQEVFNIYPNPATNELQITANSPIKQVTISNLLGQTVYANAFDDKNVQVSITTLPAGVYVIKVNNYFVQKLVKE